jgi:chorismate dehydratase
MDLGEEWYELTGYPMVFGISASLKDRDAGEINGKLMKSVEWGLENMDVVVEEAKRRFNLPSEFLEEYFRCLSYRLGGKERKGLETFEEMCRENGLL